MSISAPTHAQQMLYNMQSTMQGLSIGAIVVMVLITLFLLRSITHRPKRRRNATDEAETSQEQRAKIKKQGERSIRHVVRWAGTTLGFAIVYPLGSRLGNRRVDVIDSAFDTMTAAIDQAGHRRSKAVCLPGLIRARWIVKCDGCGQFFAFKEARSLVNSDQHALKVLSGFTIEKGQIRATTCKAKFVEGKPAQQPPAAAWTLKVTSAQPTLESSTAVAQVTVLPKQKTS